MLKIFQMGESEGSIHLKGNKFGFVT